MWAHPESSTDSCFTSPSLDYNLKAALNHSAVYERPIPSYLHLAEMAELSQQASAVSASQQVEDTNMDMDIEEIEDSRPNDAQERTMDLHTKGQVGSVAMDCECKLMIRRFLLALQQGGNGGNSHRSTQRVGS